MKSLIKSVLLASAGTLISSSAFGAVSLEAGNLAIAFYQVSRVDNGSGGTTSVVQPNTYIFDLGAANLYRENTLGNVSVSTINSGIASSNIAADLVAAFGAGWANDGTVSWAVIGVVGSTSPTTDGDPARTTYLSRGRSSLLDGVVGAGTTIPDISSSNRGALSTQLGAFFNATNSAAQTTGANAAGAIIPISATNSFDDYVPPGAAGTYFGQGVNPLQVLGSGTLDGGSNGQFEGILDIYRVLHSTNGADLTAGASPGDAIAGTGQYIGTLTLDSAGNLNFGAVPEPSTTMLAGLFGTFALCFRKRSSRNA